MDNLVLRKILADAAASKILDLRGQNLNEENVRILIQEIPNVPELLVIDLAETPIRIDYAPSLFTAISQCNKLIHLNLTLCELDDKCIEILSSSLKDHPALLSLELADNLFGYKGSQAISNLLECKNKLLFLNLYGNDLGMSGSELLFAVEKNNNILKINLIHTSLSVDMEEEINNQLKQNRKNLKNDYIKQNKFDVVPPISNLVVQYIEREIPEFVERPIKCSFHPIVYLGNWQATRPALVSSGAAQSSPVLYKYKQDGANIQDLEEEKENTLRQVGASVRGRVSDPRSSTNFN